MPSKRVLKNNLCAVADCNNLTKCVLNFQGCTPIRVCGKHRPTMLRCLKNNFEFMGEVDAIDRGG